jgi:hypothetical protein
MAGRTKKYYDKNPAAKAVKAAYDKAYNARPEQRKNRSMRNIARRALEKLGRVKKGDGKDVDHKDGNPKNNSGSNLQVMSKSANRAKK